MSHPQLHHLDDEDDALAGPGGAGAGAIVGTGRTYEAAQARRSTARHADRIHWDAGAAFRDQPYRQLHHQRGVVGTFHIRLLQAERLERRHWSALAMVPGLGGLSKAHGAVSSRCRLGMAFEYPATLNRDRPGRDVDVAAAHGTPHHHPDGDRKPAAVPRPANQPSSATAADGDTTRYFYTSPVVPSDSNPVWDGVQLECPLRKGRVRDGQRILLRVRVEEDATALEALLQPQLRAPESRAIGTGTLDLTELALGETLRGQSLPGLRDAWVPIFWDGHQGAEETPPLSEKQPSSSYSSSSSLHDREGSAAATSFAASAASGKAAASATHADPLAVKGTTATTTTTTSSSAPRCTGRVRVLVSYQPHGLEPQPGDVVALEAFARRSPRHSSCAPLLPPLFPLVVRERRGAYLLCEYQLPLPGAGTAHGGGGGSRACVRLHRNAVFVVERQGLMDAAQNLLWLPLDVAAQTPLGRTTQHVLGPVVAAAQELAMPALLSLRLAWVAARTTGLAGLSGVTAVGGTLWRVGTSSLLRDHDGARHGGGAPDHDPRRAEEEHRQRRRREAATATFVSL